MDEQFGDFMQGASDQFSNSISMRYQQSTRSSLHITLAFKFIWTEWQQVFRHILWTPIVELSMMHSLPGGPA